MIVVNKVQLLFLKVFENFLSMPCMEINAMYVKKNVIIYNLLNDQLVSVLPKQHANIKSLVRDCYVKGEMCQCQFQFLFLLIFDANVFRSVQCIVKFGVKGSWL